MEIIMLNSTSTSYRLGMLGRKVGMTRIFTDEGESIPVTVLDVSNNRIAQIKSVEKDGYAAVQLAYGVGKPSRINKPLAGHYSNAGIESGRLLKEFRLNPVDSLDFTVGSVLDINSIFEVGQEVDVSGTTIGKGFAGAIKRHNFSSQRASHGNSRSHRAPGSIGQAQDPGRVFPGKKMPGHLGSVSCTIQNLEIIRIDSARNLIIVRGAVPGYSDSEIVVLPAIKKILKKRG
ncbi:large subunit ribosomal protein L3 [Candidatus Kinetoplastibacterium oncopeltii TCC290E]|uniref:Large ribosomal subunit protein uL3 n=1 Tax=Candidatus Kinetoplastidibacterium stringomonadis TCC290E TaxID=1208920 RepID=M1M9T6_9PROT|nr:50S ribosomal protein L3 [Candidatus Kinetoplastibacterium oncopeltii]AGF48705.1 large subunit ribosomal protein L3 [Candidatus Kinetoplastibacterium oncopeltii TCC290E]